MKKFIAPLIFGILVIAAIVAYFYFIGIEINKPLALIICGALAGVLSIAMVVTLVRRYREIKANEDDDITQY